MGSTIDNINDRLKGYYQNRREEFNDPSQFVGWKDKEAQRVRFEQLLKVVDGNDAFSINDLGCGLGHLVEYLEQQHPTFLAYAGYDTFEEMVNGAGKSFGDRDKVSFTKIQAASDMQPADYTVASGIFNLRFEATEPDWKNYILNTLKAMNDNSHKGFAFNALTSYSDEEYMRSELHYSDPCELFDYCKKNFSKEVALLHDYQQYDFTILVRK